MKQYFLKCSSCGLEIPVEPIVASIMKNNRSNQNACSCGANDSIKLIEKEAESR